MIFVFIILMTLGLTPLQCLSQETRSNDEKPATVRARDLGIPFEGTPGPSNAITDVPGIEIGHCTLISGSGSPRMSSAPVRTGVTAIFPRGKRIMNKPVFAGWSASNGNGELTGTLWIEEGGLMEGPVLLTNTQSVGVVRDSAIAWNRSRGGGEYQWTLPVVGETWDGYLNDIDGFHVRKEHVFAALDCASSGPVAEGNVGAGTGTICYDYKGGIGTSSRIVKVNGDRYRVGVLVQSNCGDRKNLRIAGVPVGRELPAPRKSTQRSESSRCSHRSGSILIIVATDAPLLPHQLKRIARRATYGLARTGTITESGSGDIFLAFSTANAQAGNAHGIVSLAMLPNDELDALFEATVQATEEAIINSLIAARTMEGLNGFVAEAIPHDKLKLILKKYNRYEK
jgi:D-aminopeptidase